MVHKHSHLSEDTVFRQEKIALQIQQNRQAQRNFRYQQKNNMLAEKPFSDIDLRNHIIPEQQIVSDTLLHFW